MKKLIPIIFIFFLSCLSAFGTTIVDEDFDSQSYPAAIKFYGPSGYDTNIQYGTGRGGTGYAVERDDAIAASPIGYGTVMVYAGASAALRDGLYIRYWEKYVSNYNLARTWWNNKFLKITGPDLEIIFNTDNNTRWLTVRYQYNNGSTNVAVYPSQDTNYTLGDWHKVEFYLHVPASGTVTFKMTVDDVTIFDDHPASVRRTISGNTEQPWSVAASNPGANDPGLRWLDDLKIVVGEGDLTGEGGGDTTAPTVIISTADPSNITSDSLSISGTASDAVGVTGCKYRVGSAPDESNGTVISGTTTWSGTASGFSEGANTLYVGCDDAANNWDSDSIVVNLNTTLIKKIMNFFRRLRG